MWGSVVDASGVVGSVLSGYRQALVAGQLRVTGDPGALSAASQRVAAQASAVSGKATETGDAARTLHADWDGDAYTAYAGLARKLGEDLTETAKKLDDQAKRLATAAQLLQSAKAAVDSVIAQFDQYAQQLTTQARAVNSTAVAAFVQAAQRLGEQAQQAVNQVVDEYSAALAELFPGEWTQRLEYKLGKKVGGPLSWLSGKPLDGRKRPRDAPSWFKNSGWKKLTWDGLEGTRAPKKADTPFGQPKGEGVKGKLADNTEVTFYKFKHDQDGLTPEYDGKVTAKAGEFGASGHTELAAVHEELEAKKDWGVAGAHAKGTLFAGGEASASIMGSTSHGVGAHANVFVGGKVEGEVAADVAGIGVGANGTLQYGLGAQLDAQAVYDAGHIKVNFKAGAALGLGAGVGAKIDIDLPKVYNTAVEYGGGAATAVGNAARDAAGAVGSAWNDAVSTVGSW